MCMSKFTSTRDTRMGNAQARQRVKARDFDYLAKFTGFVTCELVEEYFDMCMDKYPDGKMDRETFIKMFNIAFPTRPIEKLRSWLTSSPTPMERFQWQT